MAGIASSPQANRDLLVSLLAEHIVFRPRFAQSPLGRTATSLVLGTVLQILRIAAITRPFSAARTMSRRNLPHIGKWQLRVDLTKFNEPGEMTDSGS